MTIDLTTILSPSRTLCNLDGGSKKRTLQLLANHVANDIPTLDAEELFRRLIAREKLGSTGLGQGIAIPHCRMENCTGTIGVVAKLKDSIDFDALDGEPVDLVFALMVPEEAHDDHLQALAAIAEKFSDSEFVTHLRNAGSPEQLYSLITG